MGNKKARNRKQGNSTKPHYKLLATGALVLAVTGAYWLIGASGNTTPSNAPTQAVSQITTLQASTPTTQLTPFIGTVPSSLADSPLGYSDEVPTEYRIPSLVQRITNTSMMPYLAEHTEKLSSALKRAPFGMEVKNFEIYDYFQGSWAKPSEEPDKAAASIQIIGRSLDDFFQYSGFLGRDNFGIEVPLRTVEIRGASQGAPQIYLVKEMGEFYESRFRIHFFNGNSIFSTITEVEKNEGEFEKHMDFYFGTSDVKLKSLSYTPIIMSNSSGIVYLVETAPAEVLHYLLSSDTARHIEADLAKKYLPSKTISRQFVEQAKDFWINREENVVHAAVFIWLSDYAQRTGILYATDLDSRLAAYRKNRIYPIVPDLISKYQGKQGFNELLRLYRENPEPLFANSGI